MERRRVASKLRLNGPFVRPVFTLMSGAVVGQVIAFLGRPVLTRLYTPEEFGVLTLFVTVTGLMTVAVGGRYDEAIMLPESKKDAGNLLFLAFLLSGLASLLLIGSLAWTDQISSLFKSPGLAGVLFLLPVTVTFTAWAHGHDVWHTRLNRFRLVSIAKVAQHVSVVAIKIACGIVGLGAIGLIAGATAGVFVGLLVVGIATIRLDWHLLRQAIRVSTMRLLARQYWRFPAFSVAAGLLNLLSNHIPIILLAAYFGERVVGFYGLALGTLFVPVRLFTHAVGQVFFVRAAEAYRDKKLGPLTELVFRRLIAIAIFPMMVVALFGPDLFAFVYGEMWRDAGHFGQVLTMWLFFAAVASPLTKLFDITQHQHSDFAIGFFLFITQAITLFLTRNAPEPIVAIVAISIVGCSTRLLQMGYLLHIGRASHWHGVKDLFVHTTVALLALSPAIAVELMGGTIFPLCVALAFGTVVYGATIVRLDWKNPKKHKADDV